MQTWTNCLIDKWKEEIVLSNGRTLGQQLVILDDGLFSETDQAFKKETRKKIFGEVYAENMPEETSIYSFILNNNITLSEWNKIPPKDQALMFCTNWLKNQLDLIERYESQIKSEHKNK